MGNGILYGVSVGPGDPELLTLKAARVLARCAVVAAPQTPAGGMLALDIARQAVDLSAKRILPLRFAMSRDAQTREAAHRAAIQALRAELDAGGDVALLNLGDVTVYSSFGRIQGDLVAAGYRVEMIPVADINRVTGYIRGGCSPIGMKKAYVTVVDASCESLDTMVVSAGKIGHQVELRPADLLAAAGASVAAVAADHPAG